VTANRVAWMAAPSRVPHHLASGSASGAPRCCGFNTDRPAQGQLRRSAQPHDASWSALWTLDGGIFNSSAIARTGQPCP
jgi:hypothetical protein